MKERDDILADLDRKVGIDGWRIVYVSGDASERSFAYTVGLPRQYAHPELVVVGLGTWVARRLNHLGARVRDGDVFAAGDRVNDFPPGYTAELIAVDWELSHRNLPVSWRINGGPVDALQIVWPDESDLLPWEPGTSIKPWEQPLWGPRARTD